MPLPYTYKSKIEIPGSINLSKKKVLNELIIKLNNNQLATNIESKEEIIHFDYKALFNVKYPIEIKVGKRHNIFVFYEAKLMKLIQLSLALVVFTAFFSSFKMSGFLWFSAIFTILFFTINVLFIENSIQKLIKSIVFYKTLGEKGEEIFSEEQLEWLKNKNKCPACGEDLMPYDQNCPECGLKLPRKAEIKPFDVSKYQKKRLSYTFKEKKRT